MYHVNVFSATAATQMRKLNLQIGNIQQSNVWINVEWINFVGGEGAGGVVRKAIKYTVTEGKG